MSLTSHLNNFKSPVRQFMENTFPNTRPIQKAARPTIVKFTSATIRPTDAIPYGTIGMALDYRIRYYFDVTEYTKLAAFLGAGFTHPNHHGGLERATMRLMGLPLNGPMPLLTIEQEERRGRGEEEPSALFFASLSKIVNKVKPIGRRLSLKAEMDLCRHCVILALYEEILRAGMQIQSPLFQLKKATLRHVMAIPEDHWIEDLCALSWSFHDSFKHLLDCERAILNPHFAGGGDVGGADADVILDDCLIDFKATVSPALNKLWLYQLLGYVMLDYNDLLEIRSVAILFARQGFMLRWALDDLLAVICGSVEPPDLAELRAAFKGTIAAAKHEGHIQRFNKAKVFDRPTHEGSTQVELSSDGKPAANFKTSRRGSIQMDPDCRLS